MWRGMSYDGVMFGVLLVSAVVVFIFPISDGKDLLFVLVWLANDSGWNIADAVLWACAMMMDSLLCIDASNLNLLDGILFDNVNGRLRQHDDGVFIRDDARR